MGEGFVRGKGDVDRGSVLGGESLTDAGPLPTGESIDLSRRRLWGRQDGLEQFLSGSFEGPPADVDAQGGVMILELEITAEHTVRQHEGCYGDAEGMGEDAAVQTGGDDGAIIGQLSDEWRIQAVSATSPVRWDSH